MSRHGKYGTGKGWDHIIEPLIAQATEEKVAIHQIKEKFGALRFYTGPCSDELNEMIAEAEHESERTCEYCGKLGRLRKGGWLKTLCDECNNA